MKYFHCCRSVLGLASIQNFALAAGINPPGPAGNGNGVPGPIGNGLPGTIFLVVLEMIILVPNDMASPVLSVMVFTWS